ncbi:MAG TPA: DUF6378 domain-containing protein [Propionibacteriaceae bacterium]|nr:DUF6378 domain-containing protein [Propionibacteriaceae bacterium]
MGTTAKEVAANNPVGRTDPEDNTEPQTYSEVKLLNQLIDQRKQVYGDPATTFERVAQIWSGILDHDVSAEDVALCLIGYKVLRTQVCPVYSDNSDDISGYLDIFRTVVGKDMIHAKSVEEFVQLRQARG